MEELLKRGYTLKFSEALVNSPWGKWWVSVRNEQTKHWVHGHGADEAEAYADALKTVLGHEVAK